jgi:predicted Zn-dependent protease
MGSERPLQSRGSKIAMRPLFPKVFAVLVAAGLIAASAANAQLFVTKKEIERQTRVQWLTMKRGLPIHPSKRYQNYAVCVANQIIGVLDEEYQTLDWEVIVFDDPAVNASVLPGGKIAIYSGIFEVADTPAALAAVLGHETAHLTQDHVIERVRASSRTNALVIIGNAATGLGGMIGAGAELGLMLPYQRGQETEADLVGMTYMAKAGYDPRATLYLWRNMAARDDRRQSEFVSTHPSPDTRMADLAGNLAPALAEFNAAREAGKQPNCQL